MIIIIINPCPAELFDSTFIKLKLELQTQFPTSNEGPFMGKNEENEDSSRGF